MARWAFSVKVLLLFCAVSGAAAANPVTPCPAVQIVAQCGPVGPEISLKLGVDSPAGVSFLITPQAAGQVAEAGAQSLDAGGEVLLHPTGAAGSQLTLAVLGLEGRAAATPCCFSNQRVHVPDCAADVVPDAPVATIPAPAKPPADLAIDLALSPVCQRPTATAICAGSLTLTATAPGLGDAVNVTLAAPMAEAIIGDGFACSRFADGQSLCRFDLGRDASHYDFALKTQAKPPLIKLCAALGIDPAVQALALQSALHAAGYDVGAVDGQIGTKTAAALQAFLNDAGIAPTEGQVPPKALAALGLADFTDANASNNQSCATATLPEPPLICDAKTARADAGACLCKFKAMRPNSPTSCACPKGTVLGKKGCVDRVADPGVPDKTPPDTALKCNALTTVSRGGACACRYKGMSQISETACLCESGLPPLPGLGCNAPQIKTDPAIAPPAPALP